MPKAIIPGILKRLRERTFTEEDLDYCIWTLESKAAKKRARYLKDRITRPEIYQPKAERSSNPKILLDPNAYYIKRKNNLFLHITKDLIVIQSYDKVIATIHNEKLYVAKLVPDVSLTGYQRKHLDQTLECISTVREVVKLPLENLQGALDKLPPYDTATVILCGYRQSKQRFWNLYTY